jgi:hypothetical protein
MKWKVEEDAEVSNLEDSIVDSEPPLLSDSSDAYPPALNPINKEFSSASRVPIEQRRILASMSILPVQQMTDTHRHLFLHFMGDDWRSAAEVVFPKTM